MIFTFLGQTFLVSHRHGFSDRLRSRSLWFPFLDPDFETSPLNYTYHLWSSFFFFSFPKEDANLYLGVTFSSLPRHCQWPLLGHCWDALAGQRCGDAACFL